MNKTMISLETMKEKYIREIWKRGFREDNPEWKKWDAPYFDNDYKKFDTFEEFAASSVYSFLMSERCKCILVNGTPIGVVTRYWENQKTLWLNIGISIYEPEYWSGGIGTKALNIWVSEIFEEIPELEHVGLTTWSGNIRMMKAAEKIGMQKEAQIRKVRFWKGVYYDSVSYGVLRDEWEAIKVRQI